MKRVEAIIRPERLEAVKAALAQVGHRGLTVAEVAGHGVQGGVACEWEGTTHTVDLIPKVSVNVVVHDHLVADTIETIATAARTGHIGDGKIFVHPVERVVRVRTGEHGSDALWRSGDSPSSAS